jgi:hypothetical protein
MNVICIERCLDTWIPIVSGFYETVIADTGKVEWDIVTDFEWNEREKSFPLILMNYAINYSREGQGLNQLI